MRKVLGSVLLVAGLVFVGTALYQIMTTKAETKDALEIAEQLIENAQKDLGSVVNSKPVEPNDSSDFSNPSQQGQENIDAVEKSVVKEKRPQFIAEANGVMGILKVPKIDAKLPIIEGTNIDDLKKGVGHYIGTALPTEGEQIVLSGHRDTVFINFDQLEIGDEFIVELPYGSFTYEIRHTEIVGADDLTVIQPRGEEVLTVTTCYPFSALGNAPDRYIFYAYPKDSDGTK